MTIEKTYPENLKNTAIYDLITAPTSRKLNECYGTRIKPKEICIYTSDSGTRCMAIRDESGELFRTSGNAAIVAVENGIDILGTEFVSRYVVPVKKLSKNGREYCSASLETV